MCALYVKTDFWQNSVFLGDLLLFVWFSCSSVILKTQLSTTVVVRGGIRFHTNIMQSVICSLDTSCQRFVIRKFRVTSLFWKYIWTHRKAKCNIISSSAVVVGMTGWCILTVLHVRTNPDLNFSNVKVKEKDMDVRWNDC